MKLATLLFLLATWGIAQAQPVGKPLAPGARIAGVVTGVTIGRDENAGESGGDLETEGGVALGLGGLLVGAGIGGAHKSDDWVDVLRVSGTRSVPADSSR